jgi:hypothetical protein
MNESRKGKTLKEARNQDRRNKIKYDGERNKKDKERDAERRK